MASDKEKVAIVGGGPAGCCCAYFASKNCDVTVFDFAAPLHTLLYTGGGRCNLAYAEYDFKELAKFYPRGEKFLYSIFSRFATADTIEFFQKIGVDTYIQDDLRIFPTSNSAKDVREKMLNAIKNSIFKKEKVLKIVKNSGDFFVSTDCSSYNFDKVVIAVGGHAGFSLVENLGHTIVEPKPALVGLISEENFKTIQGVSLKNISAQVYFTPPNVTPVSSTGQALNSFQGHMIELSCERPCGPEINSGRRAQLKLVASVQDDMIFTHNGISGPLAYKISSICARLDYSKSNTLSINLDFLQQDFDFQGMLNSNPKKNIKNLIAEFVPKSLAEFILKINNIDSDTKCCNINGEMRDLIFKSLQEFEINVISPAKEGEVVTSGGVCLDEINPKTMESKIVEGLYFCGEVIDIDGFCGGFNLQNCWSTGFVAGSSL